MRNAIERRENSGQILLDEARALVDLLSLEGAREIIAHNFGALGYKYGQISLAGIESILNALLTDVPEGDRVTTLINLKKGDIRARVTFENVIRPLFDKTGRCIPDGTSERICDDGQRYRFEQPSLCLGSTEIMRGYAERIGKALFGSGMEEEGIKTVVNVFPNAVRHLYSKLDRDIKVNNIVKGACFPIVCPVFHAASLSTWLKIQFSILGTNYRRAFPSRQFERVDMQTLEKIGVAEGSGQERLLGMMEKGWVIGLYFPQALHGFSAHAARLQMKNLPEGFILSGVDAIIATTMYPDFLFPNQYVPIQFLPGLKIGEKNCLHFNQDLTSLHLVQSHEMTSSCNCTSGLLYIGE